MTIEARDYQGMGDDALAAERAAQKSVRNAIETLRREPASRLSVHVVIGVSAEFSELRGAQLKEFADALLDEDVEIEAAIRDYAPDFDAWDEAILRARNP